MLKTLRPARSEIDPAVVLYQAGFQAGQLRTDAGGSFRMQTLAAGLVAALIAAPAGFIAGQTSFRSPQVASQRQQSADVPIAGSPATGRAATDLQSSEGQSAAMPQSHPRPLLVSEQPPAEVDEVVSSAPSFYTTYIPILISLWGQPSSTDGRSNQDQRASSLAAYHSFGSSSSSDRKQWPEYFAQCDALLHSDPSVASDVAEDLRSATMVVGDAQQLATMMEAIR
jgi:hypothetical protein